VIACATSFYLYTNSKRNQAQMRAFAHSCELCLKGYIAIHQDRLCALTNTLAHVNISALSRCLGYSRPYLCWQVGNLYIHNEVQLGPETHDCNAELKSLACKQAQVAR
jgi:hypothetical protein